MRASNGKAGLEEIAKVSKHDFVIRWGHCLVSKPGETRRAFCRIPAKPEETLQNPAKPFVLYVETRRNSAKPGLMSKIGET